MIGSQKETKMLTPAENKLAPPASEHKRRTRRVPTGCEARDVVVRLDHSGAVPELCLITRRRSPADFGEAAFIEQERESVRIQVQYVGHLLEQIRATTEDAVLTNAEPEAA